MRPCALSLPRHSVWAAYTTSAGETKESSCYRRRLSVGERGDGPEFLCEHQGRRGAPIRYRRHSTSEPVDRLRSFRILVPPWCQNPVVRSPPSEHPRSNSLEETAPRVFLGGRFGIQDLVIARSSEFETCAEPVVVRENAPDNLSCSNYQHELSDRTAMTLFGLHTKRKARL